jgi:NADPH2:quinone reductase
MRCSGACGGVDVLVDGLGEAARAREPCGARAPRPLDQPRPGSGALAALPPDLLIAKSLSFSRPVVFDYVATPAQLAERAQRLWDALASGAIRKPPIERFALDAAARAHEASNRAPASAPWFCWPRAC